MHFIEEVIKQKDGKYRIYWVRVMSAGYKVVTRKKFLQDFKETKHRYDTIQRLKQAVEIVASSF